MSDVHVRLRVASESYALPVEHVCEISELGDVAPVPGAPAAVLGVRNLRGRILPVYDLGAVLGLNGDGRRRRVIVAEEGNREAGLAIDDVTDVDALPPATEETESRFLSGAAIVDDELVGILDVRSLFDLLEMENGR